MLCSRGESPTNPQKMAINIGIPTRVLLGVAGAFCLWGAPGEIGVQSGNAKSWATETSFMALQLRAIGGLKLGVGFALLGASMLGVSADESRNMTSELLAAAAQRTAVEPQPPAPQPPQAIGYQIPQHGPPQPTKTQSPVFPPIKQ